MKLCVVTQPARREGGKTHAHQLLDILSAIGTVRVLTANLSPDASIREDYDVTEFSSKGTGNSIILAAIRFMLHQIRMSIAIVQGDDDIILFFGSTSYVLPIAIARLFGKTVIVEPRGDVPLSLRLKWEEAVSEPLARGLAGLVSLLEHGGYSLADSIITYTPAMAKELGLDRYDHKLYTDGARYVDYDRFRPEIDFEERENLVGFIGRLDVEKGVDKMVEVAKQLPDDIGFLFVGDGDYRELAKSELSDELENGKVEMMGWVDHDKVPEQLNRLKLHILMSDPTEGLPTIILESFACGTPVYATPVSGVPDLVHEGETGMLMDDQQPKVVAEKIEAAFREMDLDEFSSNCRKLVEEEYSYEASVERYSAILRDVQRGL